MQSVLLRARGLFSLPNQLSEVPEGALNQADNIVIDRNGVVEPRRGFFQYGDDLPLDADRVQQLFDYKNRILRHFNDTIQYDNGSGTFSSFDGTFEETEAGLRIKSVEANGNLYFTADTGIQRISAASASDFTTSPGFIRKAGGVEALDVNGLVDYTNAGFFTDKSKVAYKVSWAFKDANNNLVEGVPSSRLVLTNFSDTESATTTLTFTIPSDIGTTDTQFFYRIYRTQVVQAASVSALSDVDPGEEMNLVIEDFPTPAQLTSRIVTVDDITPDDFRAGGSLLYINPTSGEGILQANYPPPRAKDIALFQNSVFYANTVNLQQLELTLLSTSALTSGVSTVTITDGSTTNTYTFVGATEETDLTFDTFANTTDGGYFLINSASNYRKYVFYADKTGSTPAPGGVDTEGRLIFAVDISAAVTADDVATAFETAINSTVDFTATRVANVVTVLNNDNGNTDDAVNGLVPLGGAFAITIVTQGDGENQATLDVLLSSLASPAQAIDETARSLINIINNNPLEIVNAFYLSGPDDLPGLILLKARNLSIGQFSLTANSTTTGGQFSPTLPTSGTSVASDNEVEPNAIYFSKFQQPEAVPIVNKFNVGPKDRAILRILPLRESLFIFKEDGIYRITGQNASFTLDPFDNTTTLIAPDSAVVLNNQVYMLSDQGVSSISDTGVSVVSRSIENILDRITSASFDFRLTTFGVSYESDRAYLIWLVSTVNDTVATQCFRFNTFTQSWTRYPISKTCGLVKFDDDKLYLGAGDANFLEKERKDFLRTDYADRQYLLSIAQDAVDNDEVTLSSVANVSVGDVLVQTQYLTIYKFNQLLKMLDSDPGVADNDYFSTLGADAGVYFRNQIDDLAVKLDNDAGVANTTFASSIGSGTSFVDYQNDYNIITALLNSDSGASFENYPTSSGTTEIEALIIERVNNSNTVIVKFPAQLIAGDVTNYEGIPTSVVWAPQVFGDPTLYKQVREGTFLFEDNSFYSATVGYASDFSPNFEDIDFNESGIGDWGLFTWDEQNWGGGGSQVPLRTYVPRNKQRCRFIRPRFQHYFAREKYALFGLSLTYRSFSERAYRE